MTSLILTFGHSHSASLVWTLTFEMLHKGSGWPRIDFVPYKAHMNCCFIHSGFFIAQWPTLDGQYTVTCQLVYLDISVLFLQSALLLLRPHAVKLTAKQGNPPSWRMWESFNVCKSSFKSNHSLWLFKFIEYREHAKCKHHLCSILERIDGMEWEACWVELHMRSSKELATSQICANYRVWKHKVSLVFSNEARLKSTYPPSICLHLFRNRRNCPRWRLV